ncbi:superfamily II DNA and RNA helicase [Streptococcus criceti]|uniref:ATP-dependent RNA helicase, DEAD/DEAH box family protein n=1 Tax=Streptococcus criceti HS-6 TaxID=873449 RepID=G5JQA0_STRCG|nr:DEAD/DEAH box helicase [Streptococcus criceti]EHI74148.1 ATP-dependent RNA helicase, DEAD/DEAH box family protein [Streptococcus criceti HS-6]SUN43113.1 superfamily II DNA and RNA helicase [Streptococcus criceti]
MSMQLPSLLAERLKSAGIQELTPIQEQAFEPILSGQTVLGISPTGTGKTLAYLLPLLSKLTSKKAQQILILAPNTELAGQIFEVTKDWAEPLGYTAQVLLSGSSQKRQIERLKKGPQILIGTPGRVFELIKLKKVKMMNVDTIVLDEFDELLGDSQYQFVSKICHHVPRDHQLIYMSATAKIDRSQLAEGTLEIDLSGQKLDNISHYYLQVDKRHRLELLRKLSNIPDFRGLVFFNSLSDLGAAEERLQYNGASAVSLASDVNVKFRKVILEKFKNHELALLLATDLVARGIDIENLETVVNYEVPRDKEAYTHRAGRTGRMGKNGAVVTLISHPADLKKLKKFAHVREIVLKNQAFYEK